MRHPFWFIIWIPALPSGPFSRSQGACRCEFKCLPWAGARRKHPADFQLVIGPPVNRPAPSSPFFLDLPACQHYAKTSFVTFEHRTRLGGSWGSGKGAWADREASPWAKLRCTLPLLCMVQVFKGAALGVWREVHLVQGNKIGREHESVARCRKDRGRVSPGTATTEKSPLPPLLAHQGPRLPAPPPWPPAPLLCPLLPAPRQCQRQRQVPALLRRWLLRRLR